MIQRKQTLFLLLALILTVVCMSLQIATFYGDSSVEFARVYNLWITDGQGHHSFRSVQLFVALMLSALLSLITVFFYTKRKLQARMCILNMVLLLGWFVLLAVLPQTIGGIMHLEWPVLLPAISIVLIFMARKGILSDEKLVRSLDRIR